MKIPKRSFSKDVTAVKNVAKKVISLPGRYLDSVERGMKATREAREQKIQKMRQSNGMERYERMKQDSTPKRKGK